MEKEVFSIRIEPKIYEEIKKIKQNFDGFNDDFEELASKHFFSIDYLKSKKQDFQEKMNLIEKLINERRTKKEKYLKSLSKEDLKELKGYLSKTISSSILQKVWERKKGVRLPITFYVDYWEENKHGNQTN